MTASSPRPSRSARGRWTSIAALAACVACAGAASGPKSAQVGEAFALLVGESAGVAQTSIVVRVASVSESRCPTDVVCVHAGDAAVALTFRGAGAERTDTLYLMREPRSVGYGSFRFALVDVQPVPRTSAPPSPKTATIRASPE